MSARFISVPMFLLLRAVAEAQPAACPQSGPLTEAQLTALVKGPVPAARIIQFVISCGIDFDPTEEELDRLRSAGAPQVVLGAVRASPTPADQALWNFIRDSRDAQLFQQFLEKYPDSQYADAARQRLAVLKRVAPSQTPAAVGVLPATVSAGATKVNAKDGLTYVWIPPGTFSMGCSPGDSECNHDEKPAHKVTITRGYWMGQTEVTQDAYKRVTGSNPSRFKGGHLPLETVNWNEAQAYCRAVGMRLPTEAEWEYAARAGDTSARYGPLDSVVWYNGNSGSTTHEIAQKEANRFGLFDMLGNVWEWAADWYGPYSAYSQRDPRGPSSGQYRVLRGGSCYDFRGGARASARVWYEPEVRVDVIGVRCAGESIP
jgi:formylglycine-generating enzyme required for sulfatase activity